MPARNETPSIELTPVGFVKSPLADPGQAPRQGDEGTPEATIVFEPAVLPALDAVGPGDEMLVLTWLHLAPRDVLRVHPRDDPSRPVTGVFSTRSPGRPNPIGLHRIEILSVDGRTVRVRNLEAVDGTPVIDLKPVLSASTSER